VRIRRALRFLSRQLQLSHNLLDQITFLQNASVCEQQKLIFPRVINNAAARQLLIFNITGNLSGRLQLLPAVDMSPWVVLAFAVRFGLVDRRAIK